MANTSAIAVAIVAVMLATTVGAAAIVASNDDNVTVGLEGDFDFFGPYPTVLIEELEAIGGHVTDVYKWTYEYESNETYDATCIEVSLPKNLTFLDLANAIVKAYAGGSVVPMAEDYNYKPLTDESIMNNHVYSGMWVWMETD